MARFLLCILGIFVALALSLLVFKVEAGLVITLGLGAACLSWLVAIVVLPWNLYFRARHLLAEMERSERRGIAVDAEARAEARKLAPRMLRLSLALHLVSALLLAGAAFLYGQHLGYIFSGLFLLSTLFRPAVEYHRYLHEKLRGYLNEVKIPREDATQLAAELRLLQEKSDTQGKELERLEAQLTKLSETSRAGDLANERRLEGVSRKFGETIDRLTDNQEIISGIKAFLRLVQTA